MIRSNIFTIAILLGLAAPLSAQELDNGASVVGTTGPAKPQVNPPKDTTTTPNQTPRERVTFLLSGYEFFPTRADLDAVAPAAEVSAILRDMATQADGRPTQRLRAVDALGFYDDEASVSLLKSLVTSEPKEGLSRRELRTAGLMRHHAITAYVRSQRGASAELLEPILAGDDVQLTLTAIHALGKHGSDEGRAALATLKANTTNKVLLRELAKWVK